MNAQDIVDNFNRNFGIGNWITYLYEPQRDPEWKHLYSVKAPAFVSNGIAMVTVNEWHEAIEISDGRVPFKTPVMCRFCCLEYKAECNETSNCLLDENRN